MNGKISHGTASAILKQLKGEAKARQDYEEMLYVCEDLSSADIYAIQEIQQDEANHMLVLQAMLKRYDGGLSASPDGAARALMEIGDGIDDDNNT